MMIDLGTVLSLVPVPRLLSRGRCPGIVVLLVSMADVAIGIASEVEAASDVGVASVVGCEIENVDVVVARLVATEAAHDCSAAEVGSLAGIPAGIRPVDVGR